MGKTIASVMIMTLAAALGFFLGADINSPEMGGLKLFLLSGKNGNGKVLAVIEVTFESGRIATVKLPSVTNNGSLRISSESIPGISFEAKVI